MIRKVSVSLAVIVLLALLVAPAVASEGGEEIPTFDVWLVRASGPLISVIVGFLLSMLIDMWPAYEALTGNAKRYLYWALCFVVPVVAALARAGLNYVVLTFDPLIWHAMWNGGIAAGLGTVVHMRKRATMGQADG